MLIVGRAVQGLGGSGLQNGMFIIMSGCVPMEKRASTYMTPILVTGAKRFVSVDGIWNGR